MNTSGGSCDMTPRSEAMRLRSQRLRSQRLRSLRLRSLRLRSLRSRRPQHAPLRRLVILLATIACASGLAATGCGAGDPEDPGNDAGGGDVLDARQDTDTDTAPDEILCTPCENSADCSGEGNLCVALPGGENVCGVACDTDSPECPEDSVCTELDAADLPAQCVPTSLFCENPCDLVDCLEGEVCDPMAGGVCIAPRALCESCTNSAQCGQDGDLCLQLVDGFDDATCARDCSDGSGCPDGYYCAAVTTDTGAFSQCIPNAATCIDRCVDVSCEAGEVCDPRTGLCDTGAAPCGTCVTDIDCGGELDRCVALVAEPCDESDDCDFGGVCESGECVRRRCGSDCSATQNCPAGLSCFDLTDGSRQCLPPTLLCESPCDTTTCPSGQNCDDLSGVCVDSQLSLCGAACTNNAICGEQSDRCLDLGNGPICTITCDDSTPCPLGYLCFDHGADTGSCVPDNTGFVCDACDAITCNTGSYCHPISGRCEAAPSPCVDDRQCAADELCNGVDGRCEPIGTPCDFDSRLSVCDFSNFACTAVTPGSQGTCEPRCFSSTDCPTEAPVCVARHGLFGSVCAASPALGAESCGSLASSLFEVGRPCADMSDCFGDTQLCLDAGDADVGAFCSMTCADDGDCAVHNAICADVGGAKHCIPDACDCLRPRDATGGRLLFEEALHGAAISRCTLRWTLTEKRAVHPYEVANPPYVTSAVASVAGDPTASAGVLAPVRRQLLDDAALRTGAATAIELGAAALGARVDTVAISEQDAEADFATEFAQLLAVSSTGAITPEQIDAASALNPSVQAFAGEIAEAIQRIPPLHDRLLQRYPEQLAIALETNTPGAVSGEGTLDLSDRLVLDYFVNDYDPSLLAQAAHLLATVIESLDRQLEGDLSAVAFNEETRWGRVVISGTGDDVYPADFGPVLMLIDLGGDDTYEFAAGANGGVQNPVSLVIDLGGADTYTYAADPDPADTGLLPSDGAGRAPQPTPRSLSTVPRQGSGKFGVGMLYDFGDGRDEFTTLRFGQGFGVAGVGVLYDDGTDGAAFAAESYSQGAGALGGIGVLALGDGDYSFEAIHGVLGFGTLGGSGVALTGTGVNDADISSSQTLYPSPISGVDGNHSAALGAALGYNAATSPAGVPLAGGFGYFADSGGDDTYSVENGALGASFFHGMGVFRDRAGHDTYTGAALVGGAAHTFGSGVLIDDDGDDIWTVADMALGYGEDFAAGLRFDLDGNDAITLAGRGAGAALNNGVGISIDLAGDDTYSGASLSQGAAGVSTVDEARAATPTAAFCIDSGGADTWTHPDGGDNRMWVQAPATNAARSYAAGIDGATGAAMIDIP